MRPHHPCRPAPACAWLSVQRDCTVLVSLNVGSFWRGILDTARAGRRHGLAAAAILLAAALGGQTARAQMTIGAHPRQPFPTTVAKPLLIEMGVYLVDFARISGREETFDLEGYLTASWLDPALALPPDQKQGERRFQPETLWTPNYEFVNASEPVRVQNEAALIVNDEGRITQRLRFVGKFDSPMDLRRFPFDAQVLKVFIEPFERVVKDLRFTVDRKNVGRLGTAFLTDWSIRDVNAQVTEVNHPLFNRVNSRLSFEITIQRKSTFYLWRVLLPMSLLVLTSWVVFWFDPSNLQPLISTTVAILLNIILFSFTIDFALPKVAYLTLIDTFAVTCLFFMLAVMHLVAATHVVFIRKGMEPARAIQRKAIRILPLAFLGLAILEGLYFLT
jgi:hypothetical protein